MKVGVTFDHSNGLFFVFWGIMADPALAEDVNGVIIRSHVAAFYSFGGYPIISVPLTQKKGNTESENASSQLPFG